MLLPVVNIRKWLFKMPDIYLSSKNQMNSIERSTLTLEDKEVMLLQQTGEV